MGLGLITCGEVEDVVGVLTPVVGGVVQVFHELLVELRLLLVAEVEEGEEEDRQEEGWEVESVVGRVKETTTHVYGMEMDVKSARLKLEPMCECDEMCKRTRLRAHAQWNCLWMCTL